MIGVRPIRIRGSSLGFDEISRDHLAEQLSGWSEAVCMDLIHAPTPARDLPDAAQTSVRNHELCGDLASAILPHMRLAVAGRRVRSTAVDLELCVLAIAHRTQLGLDVGGRTLNRCLAFAIGVTASEFDHYRPGRLRSDRLLH